MIFTLTSINTIALRLTNRNNRNAIYPPALAGNIPSFGSFIA